MAAILLVVASPALLATWVVVGAWSKRLTRPSAAHPGAPSDGPGLLVAAAAGLLPADRREIGPAMAAELAAIEGSRERWSFALGCCRARLLKPRWRGGRIVLLAAGLLGVVGVLAVTARLVILDESATVGTAHGVVLAAAVLVVLVLTVSPPAALGYDLGPVLFGIVVAAVLSVGFLLASSFPSGAGEGVASFLILGPAGALFLVGAAAAWLTRSLRYGVAAVLWSTVLGVVALYALYLVEGERWYDHGSGLLLDAHGGGSLVTNLEDAVFWVLVVVPMWAMPFGLLGAAAGARISRGPGGAGASLRGRGSPGPPVTEAVLPEMR